MGLPAIDAFAGKGYISVCPRIHRSHTMVKTLHATFDGQVLRPEEEIVLQPNTRVRITIETLDPPQAKQRSFLRTARSLNLAGPSDWSARLDDYLYGSAVSADA
jgi:hypothetical protein